MRIYQYQSYIEINRLQQEIMVFVDQWVHEKKTPVPQREIINNMNIKNHKHFKTVVAALGCLLKKGYIRQSVTNTSIRSYVQLRSLS